MTRVKASFSEFKRGAVAAASVAAGYNDSTTHPHRIDDCILAKLNLRRGEPRRNRRQIQDPAEAWMVGAATALAEMHRFNGGDSVSIGRVATACGLTLAYARRVGVSSYDLRELKKAGVR